MSTQSWELQVAVKTLLTNAVSIDGGTTFLAVYDAVPAAEDRDANYITIGDDSFTAFDTKLNSSKDNQRGTIRIHAWSSNYEGRKIVKQIMDAVAGVMNRTNSLTMPNYAAVLVRMLDSGRTIRDPNGNTYQGIQTFDIMLNAT